MRRSKSLKQHLQALVRRSVWGMDIHPSAWIAATALIDRTWPRGVHIAAHCVLGEEVVLLTHDLTRGLYLDTRIGEGTLVGPRAIILPGVSVGRNCVIQPGALVNRDVPDDHVATGNPAVAVPRD
ncbi:MAG: DapH/DapD/GlmU-related protein [Sphingomonadales bacterium]|jgi:acetyltransferase-like isoleucine patch superfamily enzyme